MWDTIYQQVATNAAKLITLAGTVNPYVGAGVAAVIAILLIVLWYKAQQEKWSNEKHDSGSTIGTTTGSDQAVNDNVHSGTDDWLDGKK